MAAEHHGRLGHQEHREHRDHDEHRRQPLVAPGDAARGRGVAAEVAEAVDARRVEEVRRRGDGAADRRSERAQHEGVDTQVWQQRVEATRRPARRPRRRAPRRRPARVPTRAGCAGPPHRVRPPAAPRGCGQPASPQAAAAIPGRGRSHPGSAAGPPHTHSAAPAKKAQDRRTLSGGAADHGDRGQQDAEAGAGQRERVAPLAAGRRAPRRQASRMKKCRCRGRARAARGRRAVRRPARRAGGRSARGRRGRARPPSRSSVSDADAGRAVAAAGAGPGRRSGEGAVGTVMGSSWIGTAGRAAGSLRPGSTRTRAPPLPGRGQERDGAAVQVADPAGDRQAQPGAAGASAAESPGGCRTARTPAPGRPPGIPGRVSRNLEDVAAAGPAGPASPVDPRTRRSTSPSSGRTVA